MKHLSVHSAVLALALITLSGDLSWADKSKSKPMVVFDGPEIRVPSTTAPTVTPAALPSQTSATAAEPIPTINPKIEKPKIETLKVDKPKASPKTLHVQVAAKSDRTTRANNRLLRKGQAYEDKKKIAKALHTYQHYLKKSPNNVGVLIRAGRMADQSGKYDLSEKLYQHAFRLDPDHPELNSSMAYAASRKGHSQEAVDLYRQTLSQKPEDEPTLVNIGVEYMKLSDPRSAILSLYQAAQQDPENADRFNVLGKAYLQATMVDDAIKAFKYAIGLRPDRMVYHQNLAEAYKQANMPDQAIAEYSEALGKSKYTRPNTRDEHFNQGKINERRGLYDDALKQYYKALHHCETREEKAQVYLALGFTYEKMQKGGKARQAFQQYLTLLPSGAAASLARRHVAMLHE